MPDWTGAIRSRLSGLSIDPATRGGRRRGAVPACHRALRRARHGRRGAGGGVPHRRRRARLGLAPDRARDGAAAGASSAPPAAEPGFRVGSLWKDLAYGARRLRSDPGFSVVAILSRARHRREHRDLPIARRRPAAHASRVAARGARHRAVADPPTGRTGWFSGRYAQITSLQWDRIRQSTQAFSSVAAWSSQSLNRSSGGEAHYADVLWASGPLFETLGVRPLFGRVLSDADDRVGCASGAAVVSEPFWRQEFGASPAALGRTITLEGHPFEIVGVTPASFFGLDVGRRFEVALPLCAEALFGEKTRTKEPSAWWLAVVGRLKPGWTISRASADLRSISPALFRATVPPNYDAVEAKQYVRFQLEAESASGGFSSLRNRYADPLSLLLGLSGLVLLIALREPRQPHGRPRQRPAARDRGAARSRRLPGTADPTAPRRELGARVRGRARRRRPCAGVEPRARVVPDDSGRASLRGPPSRRPALRLYRRARRGDVPALRTSPGAPGRSHAAARGDEVRRPRNRGKRGARRDPPGSRRLTGVVVARAPRRGAPLRPHAAQSPLARRGLSARSHPRDRRGPRALEDPRRRAKRSQAAAARTAPGDSRRHLGRAGVHRPRERQRLEREHPHRGLELSRGESRTSIG